MPVNVCDCCMLMASAYVIAHVSLALKVFSYLCQVSVVMASYYQLCYRSMLVCARLTEQPPTRIFWILVYIFESVVAPVELIWLVACISKAVLRTVRLK